MLKIVLVPSNILTTPAKPVVIIDDKIKKLAAAMTATLSQQVDPQGVGLAAPQVGESLALFIIKPTPQANPEIFINPKILKSENQKPKTNSNSKTKKSRKKHKLEGCLSIPKIWSPVKRAKKILLEYQTETSGKKTEWFSGFKAIIIQHEVDHLNGILFTKRALEQKNQLYEEKDGKLKKMDY